MNLKKALRVTFTAIDYSFGALIAWVMHGQVHGLAMVIGFGCFAAAMEYLRPSLLDE